MALIDLRGQVAVVTGGGHGLGRATALDLARRGAHVVLNDIRQTDGSSTAELVAAEVESRGGKATPVTASVANEEGAREIASAACNLGGATILVHSAGLIRRVTLHDLSFPLLEKMVATNLTGSILACQALLPQMRRAGRGRIVLLGSGAGLFGLSGQVAYGATKAGQVGLARNLAHETRNEDIAVNVVLPYAITNPGRTRLEWSPEDLATVAARARPEHVVPLITFLASAASDVSGRVYSAFGGRYARVVTALGDGWLAPTPEPVAAEELGTHFAEVDDVSRSWEPATFEDELTEVARRVRGDSIPHPEFPDGSRREGTGSR